MISVLEGSNQLAIYNQPQFEQIELIDLSSEDLPSESQSSLFFSSESDHLSMVVELTDEIQIFRWETATWRASAAFSVETGLATFVNPSTGVLGVVSEDDIVLHSLSLPGDSDT
ncbi:MAG: hypothetical protein ACOCYU_03990, partial [Brevefilum sp.]